MFNNIYNNKYLRYTNSDSADDENEVDITESENNSRNIDLIVNKLENKLNENNNMKMTSQNQETTRTSKMNESGLNNFPNLIQKNIKIKENDTSIEIGDSIYSVNSLPKSYKMGKSLIDVDISLNSNNLKELQKEEKDKNDIKNMNLIQIINTHSDINSKNLNLNENNKNNFISRNKILNTGTSSLNTLSTQFDNSKYFLTKTNGNLILSNKIKKNPIENKNNNQKENNINLNLKLSLNENKNDKNKEISSKNKNNSNIANKKNNKLSEKFKCSNKRRKIIKRKCNFITILRNIFLTIIISSAIGFYVVVFIC